MKSLGALLLFAGCISLTGCDRGSQAPSAPSQPAAANAQPGSEVQMSGDWSYRIVVTLPGTRSQGKLGELLFKGAPVPNPASINDFLETPWSRLYWHGIAVEDNLPLWDDHQGWMKIPRPKYPEGRELPKPQ